jgi:uncharacterized repeat protein (TIGR01451 family)
MPQHAALGCCVVWLVALGSASAAGEQMAPLADVPITVNSAAEHDDGVCGAADCTLYEAIRLANANEGLDTIIFDIPGPTPHTISLSNLFPAITDPLVLDATTQPGYAGTPVIELQIVQGHIRVEASDSTVKGFAINGGFFFDVGIELIGDGNHVEANFIGTDVTGTLAVGQLLAGVRIQGSHNTIGGPTAAKRNVIGGVRIGILSDYGNTTGTVIQGNYIGTDATGTQPLTVGNGVGVDIRNGGNLVGGTEPGAGNVIAFNPNGYGVTIGGSPTAFNNSVLGNSIFGNLRGIVIQTPLQPYPALTSAASDGQLTVVTGWVSGPAHSDLRVEFFASPACNPSGFGEGKTFLGFATVPTDGGGGASFSVTLAAVTPGQVVTATATDLSGNTSMFSACAGVSAAADLTMTKTGAVTAVPGQVVTFAMTVGNAGARDVSGALVADQLPAALTDATWHCTASPGSTCGPSGSGNIADSVALLSGGTATYTLSATIDPAFTGILTNAASVTVPPGMTETDPVNNSASWNTPVARLLPEVTWPAPAPITYGTPLDAIQLNASASRPGSFAYSPPVGTVLPAGAGQLLSVTFTPTDVVAYDAVTVQVAIDVLPVVSTTTLTSSENPGLSTRPLVLTATIDAPVGSGTASGSVQFLDGDVVLGSVQVKGAGPTLTASFPTSALTVAGSPHALSARYSGDGNVVGSASVAYVQTIESGSYTITQLGSLGGYNVVPNAINDSGQVAGVVYVPSNMLHAVLYSEGSIADLGTLGGSSSGATALNASGQVTGWAEAPDGRVHAFRYTDGVMTNLNVLGVGSFAHAINDAGQVVGFFSLAGGGHHAFRYTDRMTDLGTLGGQSSNAVAINASGQVAGYAETAGATRTRAFRSDGGGLLDLGTLGGEWSWATSINDAGQVTGYAYLPGNISTHAFLYGDGMMTDLGTLGGQHSFAQDINAAGQVTGSSNVAGDTSQRAFLHSGGVMKDLGTLGGSNSLGFRLNDSGQVVGLADVAGDTSRHAFVFTGGEMIDFEVLIPEATFTNQTVFINDAGQIAFGSIPNPSPTLDRAGPAYILTPASATTIAVSETTATLGGPAVLTATLGAAGSPLAGRTVAFRLNSNLVGSTATDGSGRAMLDASLTGLAVGSYPGAVEARFLGDATYGASVGSADLTVTDPTADLAVTMSDGQATAVPGLAVQYMISVTGGSMDAFGARVRDEIPVTLVGATWTCTAVGGATCAPSGSGSIDDTVDLPAGSSLTYALTATIDPLARGTLVNRVSVTAPAGRTDPDLANNTAVDSDDLTPRADLGITKTDGRTAAIPGEPVVYTITVHNAGPSAVVAATVADSVPPALVGATWTCLPSVGAACSAAGQGSVSDRVDLGPGASAAYRLQATIDPLATGTLSNTASVAAPDDVTDLVPGNNTATDATSLSATPVITVTAPNRAVTWRGGTLQNIRWTQNLGPAQNVLIELSRNDLAGPWETIASVPATAAPYAWTVSGPSTNGAHARIRVSWSVNAAVSDVSDASFTILDRIAVTAPNTAVTWTIGTTQTITWDHNLGTGSLVNVDLTRDDGASWEPLAGGVPNSSPTSGSTTWAVSGASTTQARIRVTSVSAPSIGDVSDVPFSLVPAVMTVTAPNRAVTWRVGDVQNITFNHNLGTAQGVAIQVTRDAGASWTPITTFTTKSARRGSYRWTVGGPPTLGAGGTPVALSRIRVSPVALPATSDESDVNFTILGRISVTSPNTAVVWAAGSTRTVTWSHNLGLGSFVNVDASLDGGATWQPLATGVANGGATTGSYTGAMPATPSAQARIRVTAAADPDAGDPSLNDRSDVDFTLAMPTVTVRAPNTAVTWRVGTTYNVTWRHNLGTSESVRLELTTNYGTDGTAAVWTPIATVANTGATSGTYSWTVPATPSNQCRVRITWTGDGSVTDVSNVNFNIQ